MEITVSINGQCIDIDQISFNDGLNYGRVLQNTHTVFYHYQLKLPKQQFLILIELDYNSIRDEIRCDDETVKDTSDFKESGYCSLNQLLNKSVAMNAIFKNYLDRILFSKIFSKTPNPKYIINSTEFIYNNSDMLIIEGWAFSKL